MPAARGSKEGAIGKSNRLVSVFAGRELVVMLGGKPLTVKENDTLEVFAGPEAPRAAHCAIAHVR